MSVTVLHKLLRGSVIVVWCAVALTTVSSVVSARHAARVSAEHDDPVASCSALKLQSENRHAVVQSEERTISQSEAPTLRIQAESNGGLQVEGWEKSGYSVTLCKVADPTGNSQEILSETHLTFQNGELRVSGPSSHEHWSAHLLVKAPKGASLDLQANNGPLGLVRVDGTAKVRVQNGPITITGCNGDLDLRANNGPVTLEGNSGKLQVDAQNGPVTVSLKGTNWNGSGIEAHANNGPLILRITEGYQSGVLVESDGHSPFCCHARACSEGNKTWDDDRKRVQFGSGPTSIHLSAVNGPISVHET